jgi:hypothetical protein
MIENARREEERARVSDRGGKMRRGGSGCAESSHLTVS